MGLVQDSIPAVIIGETRSARISIGPELRLVIVRDPREQAIVFAKRLIHANLITVLVQVSSTGIDIVVAAPTAGPRGKFTLA